jgi:CRP/FNR family transcriptional regulator
MLRLCSFADSCAGAIASLDPLIVAHRRVLRGGQLFRSGEPFKNLFSVRSGFFKTIVVTADGREQVTGFHLDGDVIGLDGIGTRRHNSDAVALENSEVCVFPFDRVGAMSLEVPELHNRLHGIMSREIVREHAVMLMLGSMNAEERVAAFLIDLMERLHDRGWSGSETVLRMTRNEIGSYLGLTLETVSRAFSLLAADGMISVKLRHIQILDPERLRRISSCRTGFGRHAHAPAPSCAAESPLHA